MTSRPWYAFYPADYRKKTAHLSMLEHGAYRLLLDHYYATGKPLPAIAEQLHRICMALAGAEQDAIASVVQQFFTRDGDVLRHQRADEEIRKAELLSKTRAKAAKSRYAIAPAIAPAIAEQLHTPSPSHPHGNGIEKDFNEFVVGRRVGKVNGGTTLKDPSERLARFQKTLAQAFPRDGWLIVGAASDPYHADFSRCVALCKAKATELGKGWPHQWPAAVA